MTTERLQSKPKIKLQYDGRLFSDSAWLIVIFIHRVYDKRNTADRYIHKIKKNIKKNIYTMLLIFQSWINAENIAIDCNLFKRVHGVNKSEIGSIDLRCSGRHLKNRYDANVITPPCSEISMKFDRPTLMQIARS